MTQPVNRPIGTPARLAVTVIRFYQAAFSPALGPSCRYAPSCSSYTLQAVQRFGVVRGSWLGLRRVSRCHPWHDGGFDPVPADDAVRRTNRFGHAPGRGIVDSAAGSNGPRNRVESTGSIERTVGNGRVRAISVGRSS